MNTNSSSTTEAHSLTPEPVDPLTGHHAAPGCFIVIVAPIREETQPALPHFSAQLTTHELSGGTTYPASSPE